MSLNPQPLDSCWLLYHFDGLMQERRNSSALAMELRLSCTKPSIWASSFTKPSWHVHTSHITAPLQGESTSHWKGCWTNNCVTSDLRCHDAHMISLECSLMSVSKYISLLELLCEPDFYAKSGLGTSLQTTWLNPDGWQVSLTPLMGPYFQTRVLFKQL